MTTSSEFQLLIKEHLAEALDVTLLSYPKCSPWSSYADGSRGNLEQRRQPFSRAGIGDGASGHA